MCVPRLYDGPNEEDYPHYFGNEVYDDEDEEVTADPEKVNSSAHEDNLLIQFIFYFLIIFYFFKCIYENQKGNGKDSSQAQEDISIEVRTSEVDISDRIDKEATSVLEENNKQEDTLCCGKRLDEKDTSIKEDRSTRSHLIYQAFSASLKSSFAIKYNDLDWYEEDGLDPGKVLNEMCKKITMKGQWKDVGCESVEDIINHTRKCKCDPDCPVLDCRYFARVPDEWPDCLPEDSIVCRRDHGSQQNLLEHTSEYGCDPFYYMQDDDCGVLGCRYTEALLAHLKSCQENEKCDVPKCWYFRQLRSHWDECKTHMRFCFLCSEEKPRPPEPRSHAYLPMFL